MSPAVRSVLISLLAASAGLPGCAASIDDASTVAQRPLALMDSYLIAHGMATSYATGPDADPVVVTQLARLDMRAAYAVRRLARQPEGNLSATAKAVAELTAYAAAQTTAVQPATASP